MHFISKYVLKTSYKNRTATQARPTNETQSSESLFSCYLTKQRITFPRISTKTSLNDGYLNINENLIQNLYVFKAFI